MELDYEEIGRRIARQRKKMGLTQLQASELADISAPYLSNIERAISIPSTEVIMRLAIALDTTPDTFLAGTARNSQDESWKEAAELLRDLDARELETARDFLTWLRDRR